MARTRKKCLVTKSRMLRPCVTLSDSFNNEGRGIYYSELFNLEKGKITGSFAQVKSGNWSKKGIVLNYCPFCGESIAHHLKVKKDEGNNNTKNN